MAKKTVHVFPSGKEWTVKREGKAPAVFPRRKDAVENARRQVIDSDAPGQVVVHRPDGRFVCLLTRGMPKVQKPPAKSSLGAHNIQKAVSKILRETLASGG
jgi:hypothetical protein